MKDARALYDRLLDDVGRLLVDDDRPMLLDIRTNPRGARRYCIDGRYPDLVVVGPDERPLAVVVISTNVDEAEAARWRIEAKSASGVDLFVVVPAGDRIRALVYCRAFGVPVSQLILYRIDGAGRLTFDGAPLAQ